MSKRKKRNSKPNLPQATLDRARQQSGEGEDAPLAAEATQSKQEKNKDKRGEKQRESRSENRGNRRVKPDVMQYSQRKKKGALDKETIKNALANPTIFVSAEQLRDEYGYVISDLRSMGLLAGVLMVFLVALAQFI